MIIRKIILSNFGIYGDNYTFDLTPVPLGNFNRPIILFQGKNGVGKTTLIEAVHRVKSILGVQGSFKIAISPDKFDGRALMNLFNKEQGANYAPSEDRQLFLDLERDNDGRFKIKIIE